MDHDLCLLRLHQQGASSGVAAAADKTEQYKQPEGCLDFKIEIQTELEVAKRPFDGLEKFDATKFTAKYD